MNRSSFAFFVALLIHFVLVLLFFVFATTAPKIKKPAQEEKIKISLKTLEKKIQKEVFTPTKEEITPPPKIPPMPKGSQLKKILKKPIVYKEKAPKKIPKLNKKIQKAKKIKKPKKIINKTKPLPSKEMHIPLRVKKPEMDWLFEDKSMFEEKKIKAKKFKGASAGRNIQKLYGDEFGKLSASQQEYILDNMEIMRRITQEILNRQASVSRINTIRVNRTNVIEFYLHPNGDMSDFKFLSKSGYYILDSITKSTIEYAYSKYPLPKEKTLIRYNVFYNLR